jgi:glycosyltransferase involved in cell wall biosynthesis
MISFIIPAHNEERLIGETLSALRAVALALNEPHEIIVANDASSDATATVAAAHGARVLSVAHRQIAATRNSGAKEATGDLLVFVDADTIVSEAIVRAALEAVRNGAVGGGAASRFDGHVPFYARVLVRLWVRFQRTGRLATGCFLFCTRQAFESAGRFDETLYAFEDVALSRRLKRMGAFVILRDTVVTSGRNLRSHTGFDALRMLSDLALQGPRFLRERRGLHFWYGPRRQDSDSEGPLRSGTRTGAA